MIIRARQSWPFHPSLKVHLSVPAQSVCPAEAGSPAWSLEPALPRPAAGINSNPFSTASAPKLPRDLAEEQGEHPPDTLSSREANSPSTQQRFLNVFPPDTFSICCCRLYLHGSGQGNRAEAQFHRVYALKCAENCSQLLLPPFSKPSQRKA